MTGRRSISKLKESIRECAVYGGTDHNHLCTGRTRVEIIFILLDNIIVKYADAVEPELKEVWQVEKVQNKAQGERLLVSVAVARSG
jgi:hypothetical protein